LLGDMIQTLFTSTQREEFKKRHDESLNHEHHDLRDRVKSLKTGLMGRRITGPKMFSSFLQRDDDFAEEKGNNRPETPTRTEKRSRNRYRLPEKVRREVTAEAGLVPRRRRRKDQN